jgi:16S rRNA (guanine966-N2)-methyltransferase
MGKLRVIGGSARGLLLKTVPGDTTRPITDIVREALFNILGDEVRQNRVLDLFGGTGSVGIEALSRGAASALFLDKNQRAVSVIQENLARTRFDSIARVQRADAFAWLSAPQSECFDLIYVAPPQYKDMWQRSMALLDAQPSLLSDEGQIIVQINPIEWVPQTYENFSEFDRRKYGDTLLIFFEKTKLSEDQPDFEKDITN